MLGCAVLVFPALGEAPFERAEIYFMDVARAMVERGDYLVPRYQGEPFFDKPPLTYWLMAASFRVLGFTPGAARIAPALASVGLVAATVWLGTLLLDRRSAIAGGVALATTLAFMAFARVGMSDMLLALWSTLAVALAAVAVRSAGAWALPLLGAVMGLGFLTKGPIALVLPGLAMLLLARGPGASRLVKPPGSALGAVAFAVIGLGWFVAVYTRLGPAPLEYFFLRENLERFAGETYDTGRPAWFYLPTYFAEGLPWSLLFPLAAARLARGGDGAAGGGRGKLLLYWVALMLIPLSLSRGKLDYYLLPLYPPVALVVGHHLAAVPWGRLDRAWARVALVASAAGLLLLAIRRVPLPAGWLPDASAQAVLAAAAGVGVLACLAAAARLTPTRATAALAGSFAAVFLVLAGVFLPAFQAAQPNDEIVEDVAREKRHRPDARLAACTDPVRVRRDALFHARTVAIERCDLWTLAASRLPFLLLLQPEERASLQAVPGYREISEHRYLPATVLTLTGFLARPLPRTMVLAANYATSDPVAETKRKRDLKQAVKAWEKSVSGR
jgi:4-amino-4-deoxy-L-arabinose transferase-like glycosyltransferase